jgi:hypothetical protein
VIEDIGAPANAQAIATFLSQIPKAAGGKVNFTRIAFMMYNKPYQDGNDFHDPDAEARVNAAAAKAKAAEEKLTQVREADVKAKEESKKMQEKIQSGLHKVFKVIIFLFIYLV